MAEEEMTITLEMLPADTPVDEITLSGSKFSGVGYYYQFQNGTLVQCSVSLNVEKRSQLSPFTYKKPHVGDDVLAPVEEWEDKERIGYYPLAFVNMAYRGPNHWHRSDEALFCAVEVDGQWQTRYFPRQNLKAETWSEAQRLLGEQSD